MHPDSKVGVKAHSCVNPPASLRLKGMVSIALLHLHLLLDLVFEETDLRKAMARLVVRLDVMLYSVNVLRSCLKVRPFQREDRAQYSLCWSSLTLVEDLGSESSMPREMIGSASKRSYSRMEGKS